MTRIIKDPEARKMFFEIRREMIVQAEKEFEVTTAAYNYYVYLPKLKELFAISDTAMLAYCDEITDWLEKNCAGEYIAFPDSIGKHAEKSNGVFFKNKSDAILFKLSI